MRRFLQIIGTVFFSFIYCQFSTARAENWFIDFFDSEETIYQPSFSKESPSSKKIYHVGIHPLHNPKRLFEVYAPIVELFNKTIPNSIFVLEASKNYEEFENKLYAGHFDFAMPNPYQTIKAQEHDYHVFAKMGDDDDFRGIILIRKDSKINEISDLKGKSISYPAPTALAATLMPQYYLQSKGLNINQDVTNEYVGSQESSIMNVVNKKVAAGATWVIPWNAFIKNSPELAKELEVKWKTDALINNSWMVHNDVSQEITEKVSSVLLNLQNTKQGKAILTTIPISKFETANDDTYAPIKIFLSNFEKDVHPLN